jgi:WD repeat-containing protein 19
VKSLVKRGDHNSAARLLLRVAQNVSKFPKHVVQLLTSTVIECQRAGLKASSYDYAVILMRPEYRPLIDANLKRKIEAIVRRRYTQGEEPPEDVSECPISTQLIPVTQLECPTTRDAIPMCVISGKHLTLDDWCFCPNSKAPALYSEYVKYIDEEIKLAMNNATISSTSNEQNNSTINESKLSSPTNNNNIGNGNNNNTSSVISALDPIIGQAVALNDLVLSSKEDAMRYIQRYNNVVEKKDKKDEESLQNNQQSLDSNTNNNNNNNVDNNGNKIHESSNNINASKGEKNNNGLNMKNNSVKGRVERNRRERQKRLPTGRK